MCTATKQFMVLSKFEEVMIASATQRGHFIPEIMQAFEILQSKASCV